MEDPFPDHQDPDEEAISPSKRSTSGQNNNISSSNISNTI